MDQYQNYQQFPGQGQPPTQQLFPPPDSKQLEKNEKKRFKGNINFMSGGLLIYTVILYAVIIGGMFLYMIFLAITSGSSSEYYDRVDAYEESFTESAGSMIVGVILGCIFLILFFIKRVPLKTVFAPRKKMKPSSFLMILCVLMGNQLIFSLLEWAFESILNIFGLTAEAAIEASKAGSLTISMMLYAGFIGPMAEELTYRGYVMKSLEKNGSGKVFAILVSAFLFGVMHANPTQSIFAMGVGIVFAYAAIEYGIIWSLILHIANNFLFGDVVVFIESKLPEKVTDIIDYSMFIGFFLAAVVILIVKRKFIAGYIRENRSPAKHYGWAFSSAALIAFVVINLLLAFSAIEKL